MLLDKLLIYVKRLIIINYRNYLAGSLFDCVFFLFKLAVVRIGQHKKRPQSRKI